MTGPKQTLFLDEISTGLDSSTTFQVCSLAQHNLFEPHNVSILDHAAPVFWPYSMICVCILSI